MLIIKDLIESFYRGSGIKHPSMKLFNYETLRLFLFNKKL